MKRFASDGSQISAARAQVRMGLQLPDTFTSYAEAIAEAKTADRTLELHTVLVDAGQGWEIERVGGRPARQRRILL